MKKLTLPELLEMFDESVRARIRANHERPDVTATVVYENQLLDSSRLGERSALIVGPGCTRKTVEEAAKHRMHTELASTQQCAVAYCEKSSEPEGGKEPAGAAAPWARRSYYVHMTPREEPCPE